MVCLFLIEGWSPTKLLGYSQGHVTFYICHNYKDTGEEDENDDDDADKADIKFVFTELGVQNCNFDVTACADWITLTKEW